MHLDNPGGTFEGSFSYNGGANTAPAFTPNSVVTGDALFYDWGQGLGISHTAMQVGWGTDQYGYYGNWVDEHTSNRQDILVIKRCSWKYKLGKRPLYISSTFGLLTRSNSLEVRIRCIRREKRALQKNDHKKLKKYVSMALIAAAIFSLLFIAYRPNTIHIQTSSTQLNDNSSSAEQAFTQAEDLWYAATGPLPLDWQAKLGHIDDPAVAPTANLNSSGNTAYISPTAVTADISRAQTAFQMLYSPEIISQQMPKFIGVLHSESGGSSLAGTGGASIAKFNSVIVNSSQASIQAIVNEWTKIGYINPITGQTHWQTNRAQQIVTDILNLNAAGQWHVTSSVSSYLPGQGP